MRLLVLILPIIHGLEVCEGKFGLEIRAIAPLRSCHCGAAWKAWRIFESNSVDISGPLTKYTRVAKLASTDSSMLTAAKRFIVQAWTALALDEGKRNLTISSIERWQGNVCGKGDACTIEFSPYGTSCIEISQLVPKNAGHEFRIRWNRGQKQKRMLITLLSSALFFLADWLAEATSLHYSIGIMTGILASVVLLFAFILHACGGVTGRNKASRFRLFLFTSFGFGYIRLVSFYVATSISQLLSEWPLCCIFYLCFSASASIAGTRAVLRTGIVPDFVRAATRLTALVLGLTASASATVTFLFISFLLLSDNISSIHFYLSSLYSATRNNDFEDRSTYGHRQPLSFQRKIKIGGLKGVGLLSLFILCIAILFSLFDFKYALTLAICSVFTTLLFIAISRLLPFFSHLLASFSSDNNTTATRDFDKIPPPNFLYGHRFLSETEYKDQAKRTTEAALKELVQNPEYPVWLANNHTRLVRTPTSAKSSATPTAESGKRRREQSRGRAYTTTSSASSSHDDDDDGQYLGNEEDDDL